MLTVARLLRDRARPQSRGSRAKAGESTILRRRTTVNRIAPREPWRGSSGCSREMTAADSLSLAIAQAQKSNSGTSHLTGYLESRGTVEKPGGRMEACDLQSPTLMR